MSRHRRKRCRRKVRCALCTPYRWMGNSKERRPLRDRKMLRDALPNTR